MIGTTIRALIFTVLVPGAVVVWLPLNLLEANRGIRHPVGWVPISLGGLVYFWCALQFLMSGHGTPAIFFTRPIAFLIGREPQRLVEASIYRYSRNPMYVGVLTILAGEALLFASRALVFYAIGTCLVFHLVVVFIEEPHLRRTRGEAYEQYCRKVPRWLLRF